jgi:drug/metabolite transporter (DMT)-like permease
MSQTTTPTGAANGGVLSAEGQHRGAFAASDWVLFILPGLIWGTSFAFIDVAVESGLRPGVVTWGRIVLGAATLAVLRDARRTIDPADRWPIVALSVTWLAFPFTLFPIAQQWVSSSVAGLLNAAIPLFAAVVASLALRRLPGPFQLVSLAVGVVGVALIAAPSLDDGRSTAVGVVLVLVAVSSYGVAVNLNVPLVQKYGPVAVFWRAQLISSVLTTPFGVWSLRGSHTDAGGVAAMVCLGIFSTAIAFVLMSRLLARVGSTRGAAVTYIEAIAALALGVAWRNDHLTTVQFVGCVVLLVGAFLAGQRDRGAVATTPDTASE